MSFLDAQNVSVFNGYHNVDYSVLHETLNHDQQSFLQDLGIFQPSYSEFPTIGLKEITYGYSALESVDPRSDAYHPTKIPLGVAIELSMAYTALKDAFGKPDLMQMVNRDSKTAAMTTSNIASKIDVLIGQYTQAHNMSLNSTLEQAYCKALFELKAEDAEGTILNFETEMGKTVNVHDIDLATPTTDVFDELDQIQQVIRKNLKQRTRHLDYILGIASPAYFRKIKSHPSVKQYVLGSGFTPTFETGFEGKYQIAMLNDILFVCAPEEIAAQLGDSGQGCLFLPSLQEDASKELFPDFYCESQRVITPGLNGQDDLSNRYCTYTVINNLHTQCSVISDTSYLPVVRDPSLLVRSNWS